MVVNVIGQCMNFLVILYGCWLVVIFICRYCQVIVCFWFNYCFFLVLFLLYQYLLCLGMFLVLCIDYFWCWSWVVFMNFVFIKWLYLFDFFWVFNFINFISDFFLLLCVFQQWQVFLVECIEEWQCMVGVNIDCLELLWGEFNFVFNFIYCRFYFDMLKVVVF